MTDGLQWAGGRGGRPAAFGDPAVRLRQLYIVRHGETLWNRQNRMQGRLDSPLSTEGRRQARRNAAVLGRAGVRRLIASPLGRTRATARLLADATPTAIEFDDRLVERDVGDWSGHTLEEIERRYPEEWALRTADAFHHRPPGGENLPDLIARIRPLLGSLLQSDDDVLALVTHGVTARAILTDLLGLSPVQSVNVRVPNDTVYGVLLGDVPAVEHYRSGGDAIAGLLKYAEPRDVKPPAAR